MWRFLRHPNILPFVGASMSENRFVMVSGWMKNGTINQFVKAHPETNRRRLVRMPSVHNYDVFLTIENLSWWALLRD